MPGYQWSGFSCSIYLTPAFRPSAELRTSRSSPHAASMNLPLSMGGQQFSGLESHLRLPNSVVLVVSTNEGDAKTGKDQAFVLNMWECRVVH